MFGIKVRSVTTNKGVDDLAATYKQYACDLLPKSFSDHSIKFYMSGRSGAWRGTSIVQVNILIEPLDHQKALHIRIKPIFLFYVLLGLLGVGFFACLWQSLVGGTIPVIYSMIPVLGAILILFENSEKQDRCMTKLVRGAEEQDSSSV